MNNNQLLAHDKDRASDLHPSEIKIQPTFYYQIANMKAMKIVVLIKISKLRYEFQQMVDSPQPFYLKTQKGQLYKEYEIINYIVNESISLTQRNSSNLKQLQGLRKGHDSEAESFYQQNGNQQNGPINLCGEDIYLYSKMQQTLFELRCNLFPLLQQFYKYLLGHERIKKIKYQSLINKIKIQIAKLDSYMNQHSDIFSYQNSFLNIIIACQLFMGCKFVFEQKFRKSKYSLFNKYQKISKKEEFEQIFGKTTLCMKEYIPPQFDIEQQSPTTGGGNQGSNSTSNNFTSPNATNNNNQNNTYNNPNNNLTGGQSNKRSDEIIPQEIIKMSENILTPQSYENDRNELLYNYFRSVFTQSQHKRNYFPYFWLMYDSLNCSIVQIIYQNSKNSNLEELNSKIKILQFQLEKYLKISSIDYGLVGIYKHQNEAHYIIRGILCLGSKDYTDLKNDMQSSVQLRQWKISKMDINQQNQKRQIENIWENIIENNNYDGMITCSILYI